MAVWSEVSINKLSLTSRLDPEYYQPIFIENIDFLKNRCVFQVVPLGRLLTSISGGATPSGAEYPDDGIPFLRVQNIMPGYLNLNDVVYIPESVHFGELKRSRLYPGDVLLTITGVSYGKSAYVPPKFGEANINQHSVRMSLTSDVLPEYLTTFLNCRFGKLQSDMKITGITRPALDYGEIRTILVPILPIPSQEEIRDIMHKAEQTLKHSFDTYVEAEDLLLSELGLDTLDLSHELTYERNFSEVATAGRYDAQYFQPKYLRLLKCINLTGEAIFLGNHLKEPIQRGTQPEYVNDGDVLVINSQHVGKTYIETTDNKRTSTHIIQLPTNKRAIVRKYDVLLNSTGDTTIGRCQVLLDIQAAVVDGHVSIIRPKDDLDPVYLSLFLNSKAGQMQTERGWTGSSGQIELRQEVIARYTVWRAPQSLQLEIRRMVERSYENHKEAQQLFENAKLRVEQMLLGGKSSHVA